jgi:hypothetical protein
VPASEDTGKFVQVNVMGAGLPALDGYWIAPGPTEVKVE